MLTPLAARPARLAPVERIPGFNVDRIDVTAGLNRLETLGWDRTDDAGTFTVIEYALQRWARGEEAAAQRLAIGLGETDPTFRDAAIDLTSWLMVLSSAQASAARKAAADPTRPLEETP